MQVLINGNRVPAPTDGELLALLQQFGAREPFAVAINGSFVPKSRYAVIRVQPGDQIDIVQPIEGG